MKLNDPTITQVRQVRIVLGQLGFSVLLEDASNIIAVSRDEMIALNAAPVGKEISNDFIPESWAYPGVLEVLRYLVPDLDLTWSFKDDDRYFLRVMVPAQ